MNNNQRLLVGIDFSQGRADLAMLTPNGELIEQHQAFANHLSGFQKSKELLLETLEAHGLEGIDVAGEATSLYWLPYFIQMDEDPDLCAKSVRLYLLNARWVRNYKQSFSPDHKDDQTDPQYIASYLLTHRRRTPWSFDPKWLPLRFLTRLRFHLAKSMAREKNLLALYIFLAFTTYAQRRVFSDTLSQVSQHLLSHPDFVEELAERPVDELETILNDLSHHRLKHPHQNAERLHKVLGERFPLHEALSQPIEQGIQVLMSTVKLLQGQIDQVDGQIRDRIQSGDYPEVAWLDSIPGIGLVFASGIAAEIGDVLRFMQVKKWDKRRKAYRRRKAGEIADAVGKYAGLWWPKNASGQFEAEERRLSREGNAYLRYYILEAANSLRQHLPSFAQYYQKKYDQANRHKHKRAMVLLGCKAVELFVALLRRKECYHAKEAEAPVK